MRGRLNELVAPHLQYRRLGRTDEARQAAYRQLFEYHIPARTMDEIRAAGSACG